ncbi:hypothetical protein KCP71_03905 [Salmonella enterica subsp. enterica]|nr:hypothetical protein KCP71_03905 [Salmonella enterica subsp. enterica]
MHSGVTLINHARRRCSIGRKTQDDRQIIHPESCPVAGGDISEVLRDGTPRRDEEIIVKGRLLLVNTKFRCVQQRRNYRRISTFRIKQKFAN